MAETAEPVTDEREATAETEIPAHAPSSGKGKLGLVEPDLAFIRELGRLGGGSFKQCFQCATCSGTCPISPDTDPFPRKEMIWATWGMKEKLVRDPDIWLCYQCNDCSSMCPRGGKPGDILAVVRNYSFQHYSFPRVMGKMLATPKALPFLLGIPIVLILVLQAVTGHLGIPEGEIVFKKFFPHYVLDPLFIVATGWATVAAIIGLRRFWRDMTDGHAPPPQGEALGMVPSVVAAVREVFIHKNFRECDAGNPRNLSHLLTFYGFAALFLTTTFVFLGLYSYKLIPGFPELTPLPMPLWHPVKLLGNAGAILFAAGLALMCYQRMTDKDKAGVTNYYDALFLGVMCALAVTGILTELLRLAGTATLAYSMYFVHLVFIFFLLAYLPYSKFAHILYRTVAITYAKRTGRT
jgi:quinone-modifying oxidoreductase, subunit QmoC